MNTYSHQSTPAAWHADPVRRHQYRYWDGRQWTSIVSDHGVQSTDPISPAPASASTHAVGSSARPAKMIGTLQWWGLAAGIFICGGQLMERGEITRPDAYGLDSTDYTAGGRFGIAMILGAIAMFFGKGTFESLVRVFRGQGGFFDLVFTPSNLKFAIITVLAGAASAFALVLALLAL